MKVREHLHELNVLSTATPSVYTVLIADASTGFCQAINEIFHNISQLSFPIVEDKSLRVLEENADIVEDLASLKGGALKRIATQHKFVVQEGLKEALRYINGQNVVSN